MKHCFNFFICIFSGCASLFMLSCHEKEPASSPDSHTSQLFCFNPDSTILLRNENITIHSLQGNEKIILLATYASIYFSALKAENYLHAISDTSYLYNYEIVKAVANKEILHIPASSLPDMENILELKPDLVIITWHDYLQHTAYRKLQKAGITVLPLSDYLEPDPLQRASWLLFFGRLLRKDSLALSLYHSIVTRYKKIKQSALQDNSSSQRPMILAGFPYNGQWYLPGRQSYPFQIISDAGGQCLSPSSSASASVLTSPEWIFNHAESIDFWINLNEIETKTQMLSAEKRAGSIKAFRTGNLYNYLKRKRDHANDFFESGILYPDKILNDLYHIFHHHHDSVLYFYQRIE